MWKDYVIKVRIKRDYDDKSDLINIADHVVQSYDDCNCRFTKMLKPSNADIKKLFSANDQERLVIEKSFLNPNSAQERTFKSTI